MTAAQSPAAPERRRAAAWKRLLPWAITIACFTYLWRRLDAASLEAASGEEVGVLVYLGRVFAEVDWALWLALMVPYSLFFMAIDTAVLWRVINWFNTRVAYRDLFPVRASAYIVALLNEQVGKGAIAYYLHRREGVPGWQVGSSLVFIMFCEFYYLLTWALVGAWIRWEEVPRIFHGIPWIWGASALFLAAFIFFFRSERFSGWAVRDRAFLHAFRRADLRHYLGVLLIRSPAMIGAVLVYSLAVELFGVEIGFVDMLGFLPVIFFGALVPGPFRAVAITMWPMLVEGPGAETEARMTAFGFVMHNFFLLFNAGFGVLFLRRANRELFGPAEAHPAAEGA